MAEHIVERHFWRIAIAVFALIAVLNYFPAFSGEIPFPRDLVVRHSAWNGEPHEHLPELIDIVAMFYPFRALLNRAAHEGSLPLWNPHIMAGAPFQANAQSAVFAPLNILYYTLPLKIAWTANLVVRVFLAAFFMTLLVRSIGGSAAGSILSGILFGLCGFTIQWQGMSNGESGIWLPLMCYAVHRLFQKRDARSIAIAAFAFAMPVLSGHPETAAHSATIASAFALLLWTFPDAAGEQPRRKKFAIGFVTSGLLAVGLASVQLIPTLEWLGQLDLAVDVVQPVLDRHQGQGFFSRDIRTHPSSAGVWIPEGSAYIGMIGLLAAPLAGFHRSRRYVVFFVLVTIVATAIAFGVQPVRWIVVHLPVIKAMKNARLILAANFAIAALAGLGISAIEERLQTMTSRFRPRAMLAVLGTFLVLCFCIYEVHLATLSPVEPSRSPMASLVFLAAALLVITAKLYGRLLRLAFPLVLWSLAGLEMLSFSYGYLRFARPNEVFPTAPVLEFLKSRADSEPFRVAKDHFPIPHDAGMIYGFEAADGYDLTTARTRLFAGDLMENREDGLMLLAEKFLAVEDRRFDLLNAKYLLVTQPGPEFDMVSRSDRFHLIFSQGRVAVFENMRVLPRFIPVPLSGIEVIDDIHAQLQRLKQPLFDPERTVLFSQAPSRQAAGLGQAPFEARIEVLERRENEQRLRTEFSDDAVVVVSQMYYPGWRATVDGTDAPVHAVNVALTGLIVPAGAHEVRLFFRPLSFSVGLALSLASLGLATGLLLWGRRQRQVQPGPPEHSNHLQSQL